MRFFKIGAVAVGLFFVALPENASGQRILSSRGEVVIVPITGSNCVKLREFQPDITIEGGVFNRNEISVEITWVDAANGVPVVTTYSGNQLNNLSVITNNSANTTRLYLANSTSSGLQHNYARASQFCMYQVSVVYVFGYQSSNPIRIPDNKIYKVTIWTTDGDPDGMGRKILVERNTGEKIYPVCKGSPFNVNFWNNSLLACNMENTSPSLTGDWEYDPRNDRTRWCQFIYYPTNGTPGNGIQDITINGTPVTTGNPYVGPIITWAQYLSKNDTNWDQLTEEMIAVINNAPVGARFTIEMRLWNACNPYPNPVDPNDVDYSYIEIVDAPPPIAPQSLVFCNSAHGTYTYSTDLNYNPGAQFMPGIYRYYYYEESSPAGPSAASLDDPILVVPNQPANPTDPPNTTSAAQTFDPTSTAIRQYLPAPNSTVPVRLQPPTAGYYRYWVTYEYPGRLGSDASYVCPTPPTLLQWTVRENIRPAIDITKITGTKAVCSGSTVTLTLPASDYPDDYTYGGFVDYIWTTPTIVAPSGTGNSGVRITNIAYSGTRNRTITFTVDPEYKLPAGSNGTVRLQVSRQWATEPLCPSVISGNIDIIVYPLPTATLSGVTVDVCDGDMPALRVTGVAGAAGVNSFSFTLNDGSTYPNQTFSSNTTPLDLGPAARAVKPVAAPAVSEYFIHTISYTTNGVTCTSVNAYDNVLLPAGNGYGSTTPQIRPFGDGGPTGVNPAPVRVTWRANINSGTYDPPATIVSPPNGSLLCSGSSQIFDIGTAPAVINHPGRDVSTGGAPATHPSAKDIATQYRWNWASASAAPASLTYTAGNTANYNVSNIGAAPSAAGVAYKLRLYREYTDQKCGQTATREWDYTIIPAPTATIRTKNIELCENAPAITNVTIDISATGYQSGDWTVGYTLSGNGMPTAYTGTTTVTQGTPAGTGSGTISIPLSAFTGSPNKYGSYTVTLVSVAQNTTPASGCTGTVTGSQPVRLMQTPEADFVYRDIEICEGADHFVNPSWITLAGETGVNYNIIYRTFANNGTTQICETGPLNPAGGLNVSVACMDQATAGNYTYLRMYSVSQNHGAFTCTGTAGNTEYRIKADKYPDKAVIDKSITEVCDKIIPVKANASSFPTRWYVSDNINGKPSGATAVYDYGFDAAGGQYYADLDDVDISTFGIQERGAGGIDSKYGRYELVYEISSSSPGAVCPASSDTIVVNLATNALPAHITTAPHIECDMSVVLQTPDHPTGLYPLGAWETGKWSIDPASTSKPSAAADFIAAPVSGPGYYSNDRRITVNEPGTYLFRWTREVPGSCIPQFEAVSVTFGSVPAAGWDGLETSYCPAEPINIQFTETSGKTFPKDSDQPGQNQEYSFRWKPSVTLGAYPAGVEQSDNPLITSAPANTTNQYAYYPVREIKAVNTVTVTYPEYAVKSRNCESSPDRNFEIAVKPTPVIRNLGNINVCPDDQIEYNLNPELASATSSNTIWTWTNVTPAPGVQNAGLLGPTFHGTVATVSPVQSTTFDANGWLVAEPNDIELNVSVENCPSAPATFTITVNPTPVPTIAGRATQPLCPLTDDILFFNNVADSTQLHYTWNYTGGNTNISSSGSTAQARYHLPYATLDNLTAGATGSTLTVTAYGNVPSDVRTLKTVCSATSSPYAITVNPRPDMTALDPLKVCGAGGTATFPDVLFNVTNRGTRTVDYTWTNDRNQTIAGADHTETLLSQSTLTYSGGTQAGIRNIRVPENNGDTVMIAHITVIPTMDNCAGSSKDIELTVLPRPLVNYIPNDTVCAGTAFNTIYPSVSNTSINRINFTMTPSAPASVNMNPASGQINVNGNPVQFTSLSNTTGAYLTTHVTVQATGSDMPAGATTGCTGPDSTFVLVVRPTPVINAPNANLSPAAPIQELCPGETFDAVTFNSNITHKPNDVVFTWVVQDNNIGSGMNGQVTGNGSQTPAFKSITNPNGNKITSTIQVTAELDGCSSQPIRFLQRLKPTPQMDKPSDMTVCPAELVPVTGVRHNVAGQNTTGILWEVDTDIVELTPASVLSAGVGGGANRQPGNVPSFKANRNSSTPPVTLESTFLVTAVVDGCPSDTMSYKVYVNPSPDLQRPDFLQGRDTLFVCHNDVLENGIIFSVPSFPSGAHIEWWRSPVNIGETSPGVQLSTGSETSWVTGSIPRFTAVNTTANSAVSSERTSTFVVRSKTTSAIGCPSLPDTFAITVGAVPKLGYTNLSVCASDTITADNFSVVVDPSVIYHSTDTAYFWKVTDVRQSPSLPYSPGWFAELGLPPLNDPQTGSIGQFYPDTAYFVGNTLWGTQENMITVSAYVTLKKSDITGLGCPSNAQDMIITINPLPVTKLNQPDNNCITDDAVMAYYIKDRTISPNISEYYWSDGIDDPGPVGKGPVTLDASTNYYQAYKFPAVADNWRGYIEVVERNFYGCTGPPARLDLSVVAAPKFDAGPDRMLCEGDTVHLHANIHNFDPNAAYEYEWAPRGHIEGPFTIADPVARPSYTAQMRLRINIGSCYGDDDLVILNVIPKPSTPVLHDMVYCDSHLQMPVTASYVGSPNTPGNILDPGYSLYWFRSLPVSAGVYDTIRISTATDSITISPVLRTGAPLAQVHPDALPPVAPSDFPIKWAPSTSQDTIVYYQVMQTNTQTNTVGTFTCRSDLSYPAKLTIRRSPSAPVGHDFAYCEDLTRPRYNIYVTPGESSYIVNWYDQYGRSVGGSNGDMWVTPFELGLGSSSPVNTPETSVSPATYTPFRYFAEAFSGSGCPSPRTEVNLTVYPNPVLNPVMTDKDRLPTDGGCSPFTVNALNNSPGYFVDYQWSWDAHPDSVDLAPRGGYMPHTYYATGSIPEQRRVVLSGASTVNQGEDGEFCRSEKVEYLTITPGVIASFFANTYEGCDPLQVIFSSTSYGAYKFRWYWNWQSPLEPPYPNSPNNPGAAIEPEANNPDDPYYGIAMASPWHTFENKDMTVAKEYRVWLQVDNGACYDQKDTVITVYPVPKSEFSHNLAASNNSICPPDSVMFTNESFGSTNDNTAGGTRYVWNFSDGAPDTAFFAPTKYHRFESLNASSPIPTLVTMTSLNRFTLPNDKPLICSSSSSRIIYVNPQVQAAFTGDSAGCSPFTARFQSQSLGAGSFFSWNFNDPNDPAMGNLSSTTHRFVNMTHDEVKRYRVELTVRNSYGCSDTVSRPFYLYPEPIASFTPDPISGCQPLDVTFHNTSNSTGLNNPATGTTYTYDFNDASSVTFRDPDTLITHQYFNTLGSNLVMRPVLTVKNQWGCEKTTPPQAITIFPFVSADFVMESSEGCSPLNIRFRNASQGYASYQYEFGDGSIESGNFPNIYTDHTFINPSMYKDTAYYVTLTVTAGVSQCSESVTQKVTALSQPVADFLPGPPYPNPYQYPAPLISLDNRMPLPDRDYLTYLWSYYERSTGRTTNFYQSEYPPPLTIRNWGLYDLTLEVTAPNKICTDSKTIAITITPRAAIADFQDVAPVCMPEPITFINESKNAVSYEWNFGDGQKSGAESPDHYYADAGTYIVELTVTGEMMDKHTISKPVVIHPLPQAGFNVSPNFLWVGQAVRAFNTTSHHYGDGTKYPVWYVWDWGDNTPNDTIEQPSHIYLKAGSYTISLTVGTYTDPVCTTTWIRDNAVDLENAGDIIVPNIFKPDSDSPRDETIPEFGYKNYLFYPPVVTPLRKYHFVIFSRTGQLLFETTDPKQGWNGYFRGRLCDEGVYIFKIDGVFETGQSFSKMGDLTLLR